MNDGFYGLIGLWCLLILLWSGWFDPFLRRHKLNKRTIIFLMALFLIGGGWKWRIWEGDMMVVPFTLPLIMGAYVWMKEGDKYRVHLVTASFLIGASVFFMQLLFRIDPILMIIEEKYIVTILVSLLLLVAARKTVHQFILLAFGLGFSDLCFQIYLWDKTGYFVLGSLFYQDIWLLSFYGLLSTRYVLHFIKWPAFFKRKRAETTS